MCWRRPRPKLEEPFFVEPVAKRLRKMTVPRDLPAGTTVKKLTSAGTFHLAGVHYLVGGPYGLQQVLLVVDGNKITVTDLEGEILIEHTRPAPGVTYVGNGRPRGPWTSETSPMS